MGDAQSAQREGKKDAAAEEESGKVDDAQTEQNIEDKPLKNKGQISEINGKADDCIAEVNGHCEDENAAEAILSPEEDVSEIEKPLKEEDIPLEHVEVNEKESPNEADANEEVPLEMTEMDAKQNDINESFRRFFSNIGLKLTVKRGSSEIATDVPDNTNKEEPNRPDDAEDNAKETKSENAEQNTEVNIAQETYDNDSTTCPTLTDATSEDVLENAEEKTTETKEEAESDNANATTVSPVKQDTDQDATPKEEPHSTSPSSPEEEVVVSPIKRFFTTGIFSGLRKKKKPAEDETTGKELVDMGEKEVVMITEQTVQDQQQHKEISPGVEAAAVETEHKGNELKEEIQSAASAQTTDEGKSSTTDPSNIIVTESEILSSQEKDKIQASPLKRLLSGSSLKKLSKKQRGRKSSDAKLSDSREHVSDQLISSTESADNQKEEGPAQPSAEAAGEEDGAWASFKKLVTPKKRIKRSSLTNEETQIPGSVEEPKPSEGEQISDHSTEEGKKRKDSSWEAVLCGSGRRRSRKTSDSEDETPQIDNNDNKEDGGSKHGAESPLESSNENESDILASSPKQAGSPSEGDGGSTWKSFKRLVTPKRKVKDEDESKDSIQSDGEVSQDESSFSIKKLLPGRKKRKSAEKQDQVSSDEADKDVASGDEDSETPAVVPLSEFDTVETEVHIQTQADIESHIPEEADYGLQQDLLQMTESVLPYDSLQTEAKKVQDNDDALEKQASTTPATNDEPEDLTESISKHQQLSDIPEEGIITETPASVNEEAARDDTIADDLIEITSEAITAPEPLDVTTADETEMISAVSQLSSVSSKTSGNATPVPAEYDIMETDVLLHQVVETISISPKAEEHTRLEIQRRLDATSSNTGLNEELDATNELAATAQTESISEVNDSVSTEIVSEVPTEEFDTAEIAVDEVHEVKVTHTEESIKEFEQEVQTLTEMEDQIVHNITDQILVEDQDQPSAQVQELQELAAVQAATLHSEEGSVQLLEKEVISEDTPAAETVTFELKEETVSLTEVNAQPEKEAELETDAAQTGHVQVQEALEAAQASTSDSEEGSIQSPEVEVKSEDIPPAETVTDEPKSVEHLTEVSFEAENKELPVNAVKTEHVQETEVLEAVQEPTLDSDEGTVETLENEVISEDVSEAETVKDEPKEETISLTEVNLEPVDVPKIEHVQERLQAVQAATLDSEAGNLLSLEKEVISVDFPAVEKITDEPKQETEVRVEPEEKLPVEAIKTEPDLLPDDVKDIVTETKSEEEALMHVHVIESIEGGTAQELERQISLGDVPKPAANNVNASVTDEIDSEVVALLGQALEKTEAHKTEIISEDVQVEQEDCIPEVVDKLQTLTAVHVSSVNEEACNVQVLENTVFTEETPAPCVDNAAVTNEPKHEVHLSAVQISVEGEKESELPGTEIRTAAVEHVLAAQVATCNLKEVSAAISDVLIEKTSDIIEPLINTVANELVIKQEVEAAVPLVQDDVAETAEEGSVVVKMHVPSVEFEDNHRIQVQVVNVDVKSAETIVDSVLEVGLTEVKDAIDVCLETVKKVDNFSAAPGIEEQLIHEENKVTIQEVIQHVKESIPETVLESVDVNLEQEVIKQPDVVTDVSEMVESESNEVLDQKAMEDSIVTSRERQDEAPAVISNDTATEQQVSQDLMQTPDIPGGLGVSIHDHKEDLEETKTEWEKSETGVTAEELKSSSEELVVKKNNEQAQITQIAQSSIVTPNSTGLVVPQNTGIISSIGNVESPSSLSLEFKLNIQFGHTKAPASPPPMTEKIEPVKQTDVSEVGVQAVEAAELVKPIKRAESQKETELTDVTAQATEIPKPATNLDSAERDVIATQPVLLDVGIQAMETVEPEEQIKSTERVTSSVQATETIQPVRQTEKREVFLSRPALSAACNQETKAEECIKQTEEENDQDVWMDAEEVIYTQEETEASHLEVEEPLELQTGSEQEENIRLEHEAEMAPNSKTEEGESQQEMHKAGGTCEIDSEGEDFAVALEHPETATASITTMEWD